VFLKYTGKRKRENENGVRPVPIAGASTFPISPPSTVAAIAAVVIVVTSCTSRTVTVATMEPISESNMCMMVRLLVCFGWHTNLFTPSHANIISIFTTGIMLRVDDTSNCMTRTKERYITLESCDVNNKRQKWQRFPDDEEFTLRPVYERSEYCVTQAHHPKSGEILGLKECQHERV